VSGDAEYAQLELANDAGTVAALLSGLMQAATLRQSEEALAAWSARRGFLPLLAALGVDAAPGDHVRHCALLLLKKLIGDLWAGAVAGDKAAVRALVPRLLTYVVSNLLLLVILFLCTRSAIFEKKKKKKKKNFFKLK
jgi:hypothetical protein